MPSSNEKKVGYRGQCYELKTLYDVKRMGGIPAELAHMATCYLRGVKQGSCPKHEWTKQRLEDGTLTLKCKLCDMELRDRSVPILDIKVGSNRSRIISNISPLDPEFIALLNSMRDDGLLEPVVIDTDHNLIAGNRRYAAARLLGWTHIRVTMKDVQGDDTERDMLALIENLVRSDPSPADYAECFHTLRNKLTSEKGIRPRMAEYYIASRVGWSMQRIHALIRIKERLIPKLFLAFRGVGGIALTQGEAAAYAALPREVQEEEYIKWRGMGGRKALRGDEQDAPVRPVQPHQSIEKMREELRKLDSGCVPCNQSGIVVRAYRDALRWVLSTSTKPPWES